MRRWRRPREREQTRALPASLALWLEARGRLFGRRRLGHVPGWHRYLRQVRPQTWLGWRDLAERMGEASGAAAWAALLEPEGAVPPYFVRVVSLASPPPAELRLPVFTSAP